ncbi:MAG: glycosyltransferase WbuB [Verrucomicrobia bacterium]|nr:glycosyltransferase WbuB [Verrucomicrobiota bacterium]
MRIHLVTNLFAPDELAGASLYSDLARFLRERGHDVRVTTTFSYYPAWRLRPEDQKISRRDETWESIPVRRVSMYIPERPTGKGRLLSDFSFLLSLVRNGTFPEWTPDVVISALPMLSQCLAQRFLYVGRGIPRLIVVQDFVVEAALELGILKIPGAAPFLRGVQRWALRSARTLSTISPQMLVKLQAQVGKDRRTLFIPNWIHGSLQAEIDRQSQQPVERESNRLFYSGNLGMKQGLPDFLDQFQATGGAGMDWRIQIHGGGAERERLAEALVGRTGCALGPVLEESDYIRALRSATACLVTQRPGVGANFLPSKLLPALATGTPVLAVCESNSPLGEEVRDGGFGEVVPPGDASRLASVLGTWRRDPASLLKLGAHARIRAQRYAREAILSQYEQELKKLVGSKSGAN